MIFSAIVLKNIIEKKTTTRDCNALLDYIIETQSKKFPAIMFYLTHILAIMMPRLLPTM